LDNIHVRDAFIHLIVERINTWTTYKRISLLSCLTSSTLIMNFKKCSPPKKEYKINSP
jgi:hypothetical protein